MELILTHQTETQISVNCDGYLSHSFNLQPLIFKDEKDLSGDPIGYGQKLYNALFPPDTPARRALAALLNTPPGYLLLVAIDSDLDAIPWEYIYGPDGFLVLESHFVRGLPAEQRVDPPVLDSSLQIVAVPSNPLSKEVPPLNIDAEWMRLKEIIQEVPYSIILERTRPPTIEQVRRLVANQRNRIVHFIGHGSQIETGAVLCLEQDNGELDPVTAKDFIRRVRGNVFLVSLNACVSASPGPTVFSNLAAALVQQKIPYALGMRFSITDKDALAFSQALYGDLALGTSVEEAVLQARLTLAKSPHRQAVGILVLYTSLSASARGFANSIGTPIIKEYQPKVEANILPRAEGSFQGRINELQFLGTCLTGDSRPPLITIHGGAGQGKTALAREAIERFCWAWSGGIWATTLENLPNRELFVNDLAQFLGIDAQKVHDRNDIEHLVTHRLKFRRTLIVLDNAETLLEAIETNNEEAVRLAQFIRELLPRPPVSLLVTSRSFLGWGDEVGCELRGLAPREGARLFQKYVPQRGGELDQALVFELSEKIYGHPLSLQLLGRAFNSDIILFSAFVGEYEKQLLKAENKYKGVDHRHRTLYASIETSIHYLETELRTLLSGLWVFHAPFLPESAAAIFDRRNINTESEQPPIYDQLQTLWQRGLLAIENIYTAPSGKVLLYHLLPTMRSYVEHYLEQSYDRGVLLTRFGAEYALIAEVLRDKLDRDGAAGYIARQVREDLGRALEYVSGIDQAHYLFRWGWVLRRLGDSFQGLKLSERALELAQGEDRLLEVQILNLIAAIYSNTGQTQQALALYEQALVISKEVNDRSGQAVTINNLATVYSGIGQKQQALDSFEQALHIQREIGDRLNEATALDHIASIYHDMGQLQRAVELFEQALLIRQEVGDRDGEAITLANTAQVYRRMGQTNRVVELLEQALLITREVGNRQIEAQTLNSIAITYRMMGQPQQALELFEQDLLIQREIQNQGGEANSLKQMAVTYRDIGQPQRALELFEQALLIEQETNDQVGQANTLMNMGDAYWKIGQLQRVLTLFEQALPIECETSNRVGEASTLNNIALVYQDMGRLQQALSSFEHALSIMREVGDRLNEAVTLNNIATIYRDLGQPQRALELFEQALLIEQETNDQVGQATTLNNIATIYGSMGQVKRALELHHQILSIQRKRGNRAGQAETLNNMATAYSKIEQPQRALELFEQALSLGQEVDGRAGQALILSNMAVIYSYLGNPERALDLLESALAIRRELGYRVGEATTLVNIANVLSQSLNRLQEALMPLKQAIAILDEAGLSHDGVGRTVDDLRLLLSVVLQKILTSSSTDSRSMLSAADIQLIVANAIAVMTVEKNRHAQWRQSVVEGLRQARERGAGWQSEIEFFTTILAIIDGQAPTLSANHLYANVVAEIQEDIALGGSQAKWVSEKIKQAVSDFANAENWDATRRVVYAQQLVLFRPEVERLIEQQIAYAQRTGKQHISQMLELHLSLLRNCKTDGIEEAFAKLIVDQGGALPFDAELVPKSITALLEDPEERMAHIQYLTAMANETLDEDLKMLVQVIQLALFSKNFSQLGRDLKGAYREAWEAIVAGVESSLQAFEIIINNTKAVLGPAAHQRSAWHNSLVNLHNQATARGDRKMVTLLDAVIGLLDADGNSAISSKELGGSYEETWQKIIQNLPT